MFSFDNKYNKYIKRARKNEAVHIFDQIIWQNGSHQRAEILKSIFSIKGNMLLKQLSSVNRFGPGSFQRFKQPPFLRGL